MIVIIPALKSARVMTTQLVEVPQKDETNESDCSHFHVCRSNSSSDTKSSVEDSQNDNDEVNALWCLPE